MLHEVKFQGKDSILVVYHDRLSAEDAEEICQTIIHIIEEKKCTLNVIMDIRQGFAEEYLPILKGCARLGPYLKSFDRCYVIGNNQDNFMYAELFFYSLGADSSRVEFIKEHEREKLEKLLN